MLVKATDVNASEGITVDTIVSVFKDAGIDEFAGRLDPDDLLFKRKLSCQRRKTVERKKNTDAATDAMSRMPLGLSEPRRAGPDDAARDAPDDDTSSSHSGTDKADPSSSDDDQAPPGPPPPHPDPPGPAPPHHSTGGEIGLL